jgi:hypothetical protein
LSFSHIFLRPCVFSVAQAPGAEADDNEAPGQVIITDGSDQR